MFVETVYTAGTELGSQRVGGQPSRDVKNLGPLLTWMNC